MPFGRVEAYCPECSSQFYIDNPDPLKGEVCPDCCPACNSVLQAVAHDDTCSTCGLIISKYQQRQSRTGRPAPEAYLSRLSSPQAVYRKLGVIIIVILVVAAYFLYDGKLDRAYVLKPGVWQGEMSYLGKKNPFLLELEKVQNGTLSGRMEWVGYMPSFIIAVRGTYEGNHLIFEDYEFISGSSNYGLHDKKDVYITDDEMIGTDKNGKALFHAVRRATSPDIRDELKKM